MNVSNRSFKVSLVLSASGITTNVSVSLRITVKAEVRILLMEDVLCRKKHNNCSFTIESAIATYLLSARWRQFLK